MWRRGSVLVGIAAIAAALVGCEGGAKDGEAEPPGSSQDELVTAAQSLPGWTSLLTALASGEDPVIALSLEDLESLAAGEPTRLLLVVDAAEVDAELAQASGSFDRSRDDGPLMALRTTRLHDLVDATVAALPGGPSRIQRRFETLPVAEVELDSLGVLELLATQDRSIRVESERFLEHSGAQSVPLIGQPSAYAAGLTGAGTAVAVLDTGVEYGRAAFGSCSAPGVPASCKVVHAQDFAPDDGMRDDASKHGTNVSGIVLLAAPDTKIIGLDVFRSNGTASSLDILAAIDWVVANRQVYSIAAMNLSLGGGKFTSQCASDGMAVALNTARQAGILSAVATGNNAYKNAVASPACGPAAVSVGAVYDANLGPMGWSGCSDATTAADRVTCFSNSASFITMLAPGAMITAAGETMGGTSMAAPHVAGAIAAIKSAHPNDSANDLLQRMLSASTPVTDHSNGITKPRLFLGGVAANCVSSVSTSSSPLAEEGGGRSISVSASSGCAWTASSDASWLTIQGSASGSGNGTISVSAPANAGMSRSATVSVGGRTVTITQAASSAGPSIVIDGGASYATSASVTVSFQMPDPSAYVQYCLSNTPDCDRWRKLGSLHIKHKLSKGQGPKAVYGALRTAAGGEVSAGGAEITLDSAGPTSGSLIAAHGVGSVSLSWPGWVDSLSGLAGYRLVASPGSIPKGCQDGALVYEGTGTSTTHGPLTNGERVFYRLCVADVAGNVTSSATANATPVPEVDPPVGTVSILEGAVVTKPNVTLALHATDASGVEAMCLSGLEHCSKWQPYQSSATFRLTKGDGPKTVYVRYRDTYGNVSAPVTAHTMLDTRPPLDGQLSVTPGNGSLLVKLSGFSDAASGVVGYKVVYSTLKKAPGNCNQGEVAYQGTNDTFVHQGLDNGEVVRYRACAIDAAGFMSKGAQGLGMPAPEFDPPTGTVSLVGGGEYVNALRVALSFEVQDASEVTHVCVSNEPGCTKWRPLVQGMSWTLAKGAATDRTVYAYFRDEWGNASEVPATLELILDTNAPTGGTLAASLDLDSAGDHPGLPVALEWGGFFDGYSGIAGYRLVWHNKKSPPKHCRGNNVAYEGPATEVVHWVPKAGTYSYRVCAVDNAGNHAAGATAVVSVAP